MNENGPSANHDAKLFGLQDRGPWTVRPSVYGEAYPIGKANENTKLSRQLAARGAQLPSQVFPPKPGAGGGGATVREAVIKRAIANTEDCNNEQDCLDFWNSNLPHTTNVGGFLIMNPRVRVPVGAYIPDAGQRLFVWPGGSKRASDYKPNGQHVYTGSNLDPTFTIVTAQRGWTVAFGECETWVAPPEAEELCP